jgi:cytochrome c oxidase assembly factor 7
MNSLLLMSGIPAFYDFKDQEQAKEYLERIGIEYRFQCYSELKPDGCHRLADYMEAFRHEFDKAHAVYLKNCSENHYGASCYKLGHYHMLGRVAAKDNEKAFQSYRSGCEYGYGPSCHNAGLLCQSGSVSLNKKPDYVSAESFLKQGCDLDDVPSCQLLSTYYITGKDGVQRNMEQAFRLAMKACDKGHMYACANVARMYLLGEGVEKNEKLAGHYKAKAKDLYRSVAEGERPIKFGE